MWRLQRISDKLLNSLSTKGELSLEDFNSIFSTVYSLLYKHPPANVAYERHNTARMLDSLGHCEFDYDSRRVYVCPSLLAYLPSWSLPKVVLTGARSPTLINKLKQVIHEKKGSTRIVQIQQKGHLAIPDAIIIESCDRKTIDEISQQSQIPLTKGISSWDILNFASPISNIVNDSDFEEKTELSWRHRIFSPQLLQFLNQMENTENVRLTEYINPINQQRVHWLWKGTKALKVDRDWGRYLVLLEHKKNIFTYDKLRQRLLIPASVPLPKLFARVLTLCSGIVPTCAVAGTKNELGLPAKMPVKIYSDVQPSFISVLTKKLSQVPKEHEIVLDESGEIF
jgi:hypothetical protein